MQRVKARPQNEDLQAVIHEYGEQLFALMDAAEPPSLFSKKGFYGTLMEWAMRDEHFKTQLFRFVDVLPTLRFFRRSRPPPEGVSWRRPAPALPCPAAGIQGGGRRVVALRRGRQSASHRDGAAVHARQ